MVPLVPAKWWRKRAVAAGLYPCVNGDAVLARCCCLVAGRERLGLVWFGMGIPWKAGVTGGQSVLGGAEYCCVRL